MLKNDALKAAADTCALAHHELTALRETLLQVAREGLNYSPCIPIPAEREAFRQLCVRGMELAKGWV